MEMAETTPKEQPGRRPSWLSVAGWVSYDLGNTMFSFNIISLYLPLWVVNDMGGRDSDYGLAEQRLDGPDVPDRSAARRDLRPGRAGCPSWLDHAGVRGADAVPRAGRRGHQPGPVRHRQLLLPGRPDLLRRAACLPSARPRLADGSAASGSASATAARSWASASGLRCSRATRLPSRWSSRSRPCSSCCSPCRASCSSASRSAWTPSRSASGRSLRPSASFAHARRVGQYPGLGRFLLGRIFYADAANTLIAFMGIYVTNEVGFGEDPDPDPAAGWHRGRRPRRALTGDRSSTASARSALSTPCSSSGWSSSSWSRRIGGLDLPGWLFWIAGPLAGIALGGTWTADRPLMLQLSPATLPRTVLRPLRDGRAVRGDHRTAALVGRRRRAGLGRPVAVLTPGDLDRHLDSCSCAASRRPRAPGDPSNSSRTEQSR